MLRPAEDADREFIYQVYFETQRWIIEAYFGWKDDAIERNTVDRFYDQPNSSIIVVDGHDVGWLTVHHNKSRTIVDSLFIMSAHQRRGIGTLLLRRMIVEADATRTTLGIATANINPARRLYERLGFIETERDEYKVTFERPPATS